MSTLREAAQQALEALGCIEYGINGIEYGPSDDTTESAITALRAVLAQQEQAEPVLVVEKEPDYMSRGHFYEGSKPFIDPTLVWKLPIGTKLYTAPPRREWQGLTEKEINDGRDQLPTEDLCNWSFRQGVYFAEKALKERNNG
jgi:hypothetical protein